MGERDYTAMKILLILPHTVNSTETMQATAEVTLHLHLKSPYIHLKLMVFPHKSVAPQPKQAEICFCHLFNKIKIRMILEKMLRFIQWYSSMSM